VSAPPPYPRVPHLVAGRGDDDDRVLTPAEASALLSRPVTVEEKLDGANVMVWVDNGRLECSLRSGPGSTDRARQLGPLRAWTAERADQLRYLLRDGRSLYAEWLWLTHTVAYDRLASYLVVLDLRRADATFLTVDERNAACAAVGLTTPPELYRGMVRDVDGLEALVGPSHVGSLPAEGVVVRPLDGGEPRAAKLLRRGFRRLDDDAWARGRPRNALAVPQDRQALWR
jgi:hypothetical protein